MENIANIIQGIFHSIGEFFSGVMSGIGGLFSGDYGLPDLYTAVARWVFIFLAVFILLKSFLSLLKSKNPSEVWAYLHLNTGENIPITHWEKCHRKVQKL